MPSPVTTLPRARSSMVEDAQVGRRLARARWPLRAWGASAVAALARSRALFSIMLTLGQPGSPAPFFAGKVALVLAVDLFGKAVQLQRSAR